MRIKKYIIIVNTFWQRALAYRFTVAAYRIWEIAEILAFIVMLTMEVVWKSDFHS